MALLGAVTVILSACGQYPREIYIDERFSPEEVGEIRRAIREVNTLARLIDEDRLVEFAGRFSDGNGKFEQSNVDNDRNELYRIGSADECLDFVDDYEDEYSSLDNLNGFYTGTDIGILVFNTERTGRPLWFVAMHELGHFVGMGHVTTNRHAVMHPHACCADHFTEADKEEFCLEHGCDPD